MATPEPAFAPETPNVKPPPPPPVMALRTYTSLRLGSVAVIALLGIAILREVYHGPDACLQGSISAYYYTPVQTVFVGTVLALGFVMIVLWGRTTFEDGFLNLAGLLAPVVAFVPTDDTNTCGIKDAFGKQVQSDDEKEKVIEANYPAIDNNMTAYLYVVIAVLVVLLALGIIAYSAKWESITERPRAFWLPWGSALALWIFGASKFWWDRTWIYDDAHKWAANVMFVFIGFVVINIGYHKWKDKREKGRTQAPAVKLRLRERKPGAAAYGTIAALMLIGFVVLDVFHLEVDHRTFWLEAWEIFLLAVFWTFQTWDRWNEGAPPSTDDEADRMGRPRPPRMALPGRR